MRLLRNERIHIKIYFEQEGKEWLDKVLIEEINFLFYRNKDKLEEQEKILVEKLYTAETERLKKWKNKRRRSLQRKIRRK